MDAFDIFKKLSQGAKFKRKLPINNLDTVQEKKIKQEIKNDKEVLKIKEEPTYEIQSNIKNDENTESVADRELTLLGSMVATESGRKKKKEKKKVLDESKKLMLEQEKIKQYRNENRIHVYGRHIPPPIKSFTDLKIKEDLIENLAKCGYNEPTPIQKQAIPIMLQRRQILACAPTGSGKTAAFMLPIIHSLDGPQRKGFRALILCPTRELAKQSQRECARLAEGRGFRIHVISKIKEGLTNYGPKSNQKFDILVTTPNRICYLLNQDPPALCLSNVEWLVVDEADKLFEEGTRGFRDQLDQIMKSCTSEKLKIAMFSATQTVDVSRWCKKNMKGLINITVGLRNAATDLVDQELLFVGNESGKLLAFRNLLKKGLAPPVLVFVQSKDRAQQLFSELIYDGINVDAIHADRTQTQRDNTVRSFREGKIWVLICTELMARGVDFKGVNLVINYDFPPSAIAYVHRIGRAGRAGRRGKAITFFTVDDTPNLRSIAHILKQSGCDVPDYMLAMKKTSKKERNKVIDREDISTKLRYISSKKLKKRRMLRRKRMAEEYIEDPPMKKIKIAKGDDTNEKIKPKKKFSGKKKTHVEQITGTKKKIKLGQKSSVKKKVKSMKTNGVNVKVKPLKKKIKQKVKSDV